MILLTVVLGPDLTPLPPASPFFFYLIQSKCQEAGLVRRQVTVSP